MRRVRSARQKDEDRRRALELERKKERGFERNFKRKVEKKPCNGCDEKEKREMAAADEGDG